MTDYYSILGVQRGASAEEIKRAYRKLAGQHHPDKGGDKLKFQEIQKAYEVLGDPQKRAQHDNPQPQAFHFNFGGPGAGFDMDAIFGMFGQQFRQQHPHHRQQQTRMSLWVTLQDVAQGGTRTVSIGTQQGTIAVDIEIPLGINDGDHVQYGGIGPGGTDLIINFRIHPNPKWQRQGNHLIVEQQVSIWDCMVGGEVNVQDILGNTLSLTIPPGTQPHSFLRLKGRGLKTRGSDVGDLHVKIIARIPDKIDPELAEQIKNYKNNHIA